MLPNIKSILIEGFEETGQAKPMKSREFTYKDMQNSFNLQSLFITKKPIDTLGGDSSQNSQGEDDSDEVVATISHEKFPITIEYYYGYGDIDEDQDKILIKDKDGNVLEEIPNSDGRFAVVKRQVYRFFNRDDG